MKTFLGAIELDTPTNAKSMPCKLIRRMDGFSVTCNGVSKMAECIDVIKAMVQLFALDPDSQVSYAAEIPEQGYGSIFAWGLPHSPLKELAINFDDYIPWLEESLGSCEGEAVLLARELSEVLGLMQASSAALDLWSKQALRDRAIWRLVRRSARLLLKEAGWTAGIPNPSFEQLVETVRD